MRVKSRKPPAENLSTSERVTVSKLVGRADDGVGDQMRQMAGDREHQVVMLRRHDLDVGAEQAPERSEPLHRLWVGPLGRRQNAPAILEQFGEAGVGAGMLGARDRMGRHEMHIVRQMRAHVPHDRPLHRADIGHDRAGFEMRRDLLGHGAANADGHADNDEIGAFDGLRVGLDDLIGNAELDDALARLRRARSW